MANNSRDGRKPSRSGKPRGAGRAGASGGSRGQGGARGQSRSGGQGDGSGRGGARGQGGGSGRSGASSGKQPRNQGRGGYQQGSRGRDDRYGDADRGQKKMRRDLEGAATDLPFWVIEDLSRVTPKERVSAALSELGAATNAMIEGRYKVALRAARRAKDLAPRDATVRETLGLAAYRTGDWQTALKELRAYRRIAGEPTHLPVEMDVLRALGRGDDVAKAWKELKALRTAPAVHKEGLVVYAAHLIDEGRPDEARKLTTPKSIKPNPYPADLRVWYIAARANAVVGDGKAARQLRDAVTLADPAFPGLDDLDYEISKI